MYDLKDRNILVTGGAGSGVGVGIVQAVLEAGGRPIINDRDSTRLTEAKKRFPAAEIIHGDIAIADSVDTLMREIVARVGVVHHLVNNAGVGLHKAPHLCVEADFDTLIGIDLRGTWLMTRAWLRHVLGENGQAFHNASSVNISSIHAQKTMAGYGLYASAKGAIDSLTRSLAVHYGKAGIRFNGVAPGYVHSDQNIDLARNWTDDPAGWVDNLITNHQALPALIHPLDVGRTVVFLLSGDSRAVTGQTLTVDAGSTCLVYPNNFV